MNNYIRQCPTCLKTVSYSSQYKLTRANRENSTCKSCARGRQVITEETRKKWSITRTGRKLSPETKKKLSLIHKGRKISEEQKKQISIKNTGRKFSDEFKQRCRERMLGNVLSEETKRKLRLAAIKRIGQVFPSYNATACKLFDDINTKFNLNGKHAENGGEFYIKELGYWVDYYEPNLNLVIEYDEKHHKRNKNKIKDAKRQTEIVELLNCKFIRINETDDIQTVYTILKEVTQ